MSIDLSQFHQVFFEESFEGLDIMESGLLELSPDAVNSDDINTIFRAAHSIKGGAGTFGFQLVSDFTHVVETLLDQYRAGSRPVTQSGVDLILESVDVLRALLQDLQAGSSPDTSASDALKKQFEIFLSAETEPEPSSYSEEQSSSQRVTPTQLESNPDSAGSDSGHWAIVFKPSADIVQTGNEPFRIIRELSELGTVSVQVQTDRLPEFTTLDPEQIFLYWHIQLYASCTKEVVLEVFEWVIDDSKVDIEWVTDQELVTVVDNQQTESTQESVMPATEAIGIDTVPDETTENQPGESQKSMDSKPVRAAAVETQSIRVSIDKIDSLINMVGELVITQSMLGQIGHDFSVDKLQRLQEGLMQLEQNTREMQESVMRIRMVPISFTFSRFPRLVRDIAKKLGKKINLQLLGENTELDKTVMEKIGDPLVHMVRNSMDHGIESPEQRLAHGKPAEGQLTLNAYHQGGYIVIEISDDGKGIDPQVIRKKAIQNGLIAEDEQLSDQQLQELIFHPGLSTAEAVSDLSGRGVGMDVVKRNIQELKGTVELVSKVGEGSLFRIKLPLTLSILDGQLLRLGDETFVLPLTSIIESIEVRREQVSTVAGETDVIVLRDEYVPVVRLYEVFNIEPVNKSLFDGIVVVVESANQKIGLHVDDLLAQQQVVIKSLDTNYKRIEGLSGATILGDGTVALIVDIAGLLNIVGDKIDQTSVAMKTAS
ncbi:chemotaxis protein CheA [Reinekea sp. G2M2-21]|uniref:chemotaxis protein CheA n=1 Tax=Reinekea sp. G2M2-21 TaxID=2788942 RepID=UPI0018AB3873|nr:chemotaxis protein CheA [Reinekea sp. G2M2-21]